MHFIEEIRYISKLKFYEKFDGKIFLSWKCCNTLNHMLCRTQDVHLHCGWTDPSGYEVLDNLHCAVETRVV